MRTEYGSRGQAAAVCNSSAGDSAYLCPADANTYLRTLETDPWGHVVKERRGNSAAMDVTREYVAASGRIFSICAGNSASCNLMSEGYAWDAAGNLSTQQKENRYLESFTYDSLNRLTQGTLLMQDGITVNQVSLSLQYDQLGNVCRRTTLGASTYDFTYIGRSGCGLGGANSTFGGGGTGTLGPHQVGQQGSDNFYYYDGRGNQTIKQAASSTYNRTLQYSADDKAYDALAGNGSRTRFRIKGDGGN